MNRGNLEILIRALENETLAKVPEPGLRVGFNMNFYCNEWDDEETARDHTGRGCGTLACLAGWTVLTIDGTFQPAMVFTRATELLGLEQRDAARLFEPSPQIVGDYSEVSLEWALQTCRVLLRTGEVDWEQSQRELVE